MDEDREAFERVIAAAPVDVGPRLVFADWLDERGLYDEATEMRRWTHEMLVAKEWLKNFAKESGSTYEKVTRAAIKYRDTGEETGVGMNFDLNNNLCGDYDQATGFTNEPLKEFWKNIELVFGVPIPTERLEDDPFVCCEFDADYGEDAYGDGGFAETSLILATEFARMSLVST